jgi:tetrahydromethanopterin S-methyltransferase subunit G
MKLDSRKRLLEIAEAIAATNANIRLAYNEKDNSKGVNLEAAHFLKRSGKRVGRDIELYAFMGEISSVIEMLCDFLNEVLCPLKLQNSPPGQAVLDWGYEELSIDQWDEWEALFRIEPKKKAKKK